MEKFFDIECGCEVKEGQYVGFYGNYAYGVGSNPKIAQRKATLFLARSDDGDYSRFCEKENIKETKKGKEIYYSSKIEVKLFTINWNE